MSYEKQVLGMQSYCTTRRLQVLQYRWHSLGELREAIHGHVVILYHMEISVVTIQMAQFK